MVLGGFKHATATLRLAAVVLAWMVNPLGPIAPKRARITSSLQDNSDNSRAITALTAHRLSFQRCTVTARIHTLNSLCYNFTFQ